MCETKRQEVCSLNTSPQKYFYLVNWAISFALSSSLFPCPSDVVRDRGARSTSDLLLEGNFCSGALLDSGEANIVRCYSLPLWKNPNLFPGHCVLRKSLEYIGAKRQAVTRSRGFQMWTFISASSAHPDSWLGLQWYSPMPSFTEAKYFLSLRRPQWTQPKPRLGPSILHFNEYFLIRLFHLC